MLGFGPISSSPLAAPAAGVLALVSDPRFIVGTDTVRRFAIGASSARTFSIGADTRRTFTVSESER